MAALRRFCLVLALALALVAVAPAQAQSVARWRPHIEEASARFGIPAEWIERVMQAESGGRTTLRGRPIASHAGAMGLMQLMPGTWAAMRVRLGLGDDPHAPRDNILAGTLYLRLMYDRFGYPGLFGAYNAGPGRYAAYLANRQTLPRETQGYLAAVSGIRSAARTAASAVPPHATPSPPAPSKGIFFKLRGAPSAAGGEAEAPPPLFLPLSR